MIKILELKHLSRCGQYQSYDITILVFKGDVNKYILDFCGYVADGPLEFKEDFGSFSDLLLKLNNLFDDMGIGFAEYEIVYIGRNHINIFTKHLINILNNRKYKKKWIPENCLNSFNQRLNIKLKCIKNAKKFNFSEIEISENEFSDKNKLYFVGKLDLDTDSIIIRNKKDEPIKIIPKSKFFVQAKKINGSVFWYFKKSIK